MHAGARAVLCVLSSHVQKDPIVHTQRQRRCCCCCSAICCAAGGEAAQPLKQGEPAPPQRQTLFFSATWPKEVQHIARQLCRNDPVRVFVGNVQVRHW